MAVAFDAVSSATSASASSLTWSHTCTGSNLCLVVGVSAFKSGGITVSSVTYNSVNLTAVTNADIAYYVGGNGRAQLWALAGPATGANNVVVTFSGAGEVNAGAMSFTGVNQTTPTSGGAAAQASSATPSVTVTSAAGNLVVDVVGAFNTDFTPGAGQTERYETTPGAQEEAAGSHEDGAASVSMDWTLATSRSWGIAACSVDAATGGASSPVYLSTRTLLGVGR